MAKAWPGVQPMRHCRRDVGLSTAPQQSQDHVAQCRHHLRRRPGSHLGCVLPQGHIPDVVQPVLNSPVAPYILQQFPRPGLPPQADDSVGVSIDTLPFCSTRRRTWQTCRTPGQSRYSFSASVARNCRLPATPVTAPPPGRRYWAPHTGSANAKAMASYSSRWFFFTMTR